MNSDALSKKYHFLCALLPFAFHFVALPRVFDGSSAYKHAEGMFDLLLCTSYTHLIDATNFMRIAQRNFVISRKIHFTHTAICQTYLLCCAVLCVEICTLFDGWKFLLLWGVWIQVKCANKAVPLVHTSGTFVGYDVKLKWFQTNDAYTITKRGNLCFMYTVIDNLQNTTFPYNPPPPYTTICICNSYRVVLGRCSISRVWFCCHAMTTSNKSWKKFFYAMRHCHTYGVWV